MNKILKLSLVAVVVIAIGGAYVFPKFQFPLGGLAGPDIQSPYLSVDGLVHEYRRVALNKATTTPCAVRSPSATSTLVLTSLQINVSSSTATVWSASKATSAFATTTSLLEFAASSGVKGTMFLNATSTAIDSKFVFGPNEYLVWGLEGIEVLDLTSDKLLGVCQAEFVVTS